MLNHLSQHIAPFRKFSIKDVSWTADTNPNSGLNEKDLLKPGVDNATLIAKDAAQGVKQRYEIVTLAGEIKSFDGDYRLALDQIKSFLKNLQNIKHIKSAVALQMPLDLSPDANISENTSMETQKSKAEFVIRVIYREDHENRSS